jgi:hypothetical protein
MSEAAIRLAIFVICTACATIASYDARRRGMNWPLWGFLFFFFTIIPLPVYLIVRNPLPSSSTKPYRSLFDVDRRKQR